MKDFNILLEEWNQISQLEYSDKMNWYYFNGISCAEVIPKLNNLTVVITRDKYVLPPDAWTMDDLRR